MIRIIVARAQRSCGSRGAITKLANEAFARVKIDQLLKDADWTLTDGRSVRFEYVLDDGGKADYALFDRQGRALAVLEAKRTSVNLSSGEAQGRRYADHLGVPFIFLSNGEEIWFCDKDQDAHFRKVETVFSQDDLISPLLKCPLGSGWAIGYNRDPDCEAVEGHGDKDQRHGLVGVDDAQKGSHMGSRPPGGSGSDQQPHQNAEIVPGDVDQIALVDISRPRSQVRRM